jgi:hypothetical protein
MKNMETINQARKSIEKSLKNRKNRIKLITDEQRDIIVRSFIEDQATMISETFNNNATNSSDSKSLLNESFMNFLADSINRVIDTANQKIMMGGVFEAINNDIKEGIL